MSCAKNATEKSLLWIGTWIPNGVNYIIYFLTVRRMFSCGTHSLGITVLTSCWLGGIFWIHAFAAGLALRGPKGEVIRFNLGFLSVAYAGLYICSLWDCKSQARGCQVFFLCMPPFLQLPAPVDRGLALLAAAGGPAQGEISERYGCDSANDSRQWSWLLRHGVKNVAFSRLWFIISWSDTNPAICLGRGCFQEKLKKTVLRKPA